MKDLTSRRAAQPAVWILGLLALCGCGGRGGKQSEKAAVEPVVIEVGDLEAEALARLKRVRARKLPTGGKTIIPGKDVREHRFKLPEGTCLQLVCVAAKGGPRRVSEIQLGEAGASKSALRGRLAERIEVGSRLRARCTYAWDRSGAPEAVLKVLNRGASGQGGIRLLGMVGNSTEAPLEVDTFPLRSALLSLRVYDSAGKQVATVPPPSPPRDRAKMVRELKPGRVLRFEYDLNMFAPPLKPGEYGVEFRVGERRTPRLAVRVTAGGRPRGLTLEYVQSADPAADCRAAVAAGDLRFVGVMNVGLTVPGAPDYRKRYSKHGVKVISGTTDALEGRRALDRQLRARRYAETYNRLLIEHLAGRSGKKRQ
jgi:hypothetical protein